MTCNICKSKNHTTEFHSNKIALATKNKIFTKEHRENISRAKKNQPSHRKGLTMVEEYGLKKANEVRKKQRNARIGTKHSKSTKLKIVAALKRRVVSKETREKMRESMLKRKVEKGYINSPEARKKISGWNKGKKLSDETKEKLRNAMKKLYDSGIKKHPNEILSHNKKIMTRAEKKVYDFLTREVGLVEGDDFYYNTRDLTGNTRYFPDFQFKNGDACIEVDGEYWHQDEWKEMMRDLGMIIRSNIVAVHFTEKQILDDFEAQSGIIKNIALLGAGR